MFLYVSVCFCINNYAVNNFLKITTKIKWLTILRLDYKKIGICLQGCSADI